MFRHSLLWRLDLKEDSHRRRLKTLPNHNGSTHSEAVRSTPDQQDINKQRYSTCNECGVYLLFILSSFDPNLLLSPLPTEEEKIGEERVGEEEGETVNETKEGLLNFVCVHVHYTLLYLLFLCLSLFVFLSIYLLPLFPLLSSPSPSLPQSPRFH